MPEATKESPESHSAKVDKPDIKVDEKASIPEMSSSQADKEVTPSEDEVE